MGMRFRISLASRNEDETGPPWPGAFKGQTTAGFYEWQIDVNTLEDLMKLVRAAQSALIIDERSITIYDDYIE